jgi:hypothetical protein
MEWAMIDNKKEREDDRHLSKMARENVECDARYGTVGREKE